MSSRKITDCHPLLQPLVQDFQHNCMMAGVDVLITCTWRSPQEQDDLYAQGRTKPGAIVTNAKAGQSAHNFMLNGLPASLAIDVVPLRYGKPVWGTAGDDLVLWQKVIKAGEDAGLESASRWTKMREYPHLQHPRYAELSK